MPRIERNQRLYVTAQQAATELNVALTTVYAYVSRGFIQSIPSEDGRSHLYLAEDVRNLRKRRGRLGKANVKEGGVAASISWGAPILDTEISLIADERLYYRGIDACKLADTATLEDVATILWGCEGSDPFATQSSLPMPQFASDLLAANAIDPIARTLSALPHIADGDLSKHNKSDEGRWQLGARLLRSVATFIVGQPISDRGIHQHLADIWASDQPAAPELFRKALVLCAEHELNVSSFTVRCAISSGATLYHSIIAGLCALTGPKHGGVTFGMNALLHDLAETNKPLDLVKRRLDGGEAFRGFTHPLYPCGDPRAKYLVNAMNEQFRDDPFMSKVNELLSLIETAAGAYPTIDFALSLLARQFSLPHHAGISIFALGRTVGWIAHAQEQDRTATLIRPRARYVGEAIKEKL